MAYTAVDTIPFAGGAAVDVATTYSSLTFIVSTTAGYLKQDGGGRMYKAFSTATPRLLRAAGSYTNDQYATWELDDITTGFATDWMYLVLQASADTSANADYYAARVNNATGSKTTELIKVTNGSLASLASTTSAAWVDGDIMLAEIVGGVLTVYRNGASVLTYDDSASPFTGGKPGFGLLPTAGATVYVGPVEMGDVTSGGSSTVSLLGGLTQNILTIGRLVA